MTERSFYQRALLLPVVTTIASWAVIYAERRTGYVSKFAEPIFGVALFLGYGGLWGGIPYLFVAIFILRSLRQPNGPRISYARLLVLAPIGVVVMAYLMALLFAIAKRDITILGGAYFFSLWATIIGYGYVIVIWGTLKIAQRCNRVTA